MKFYSPAFERGLKRAVKETIRADPELFREKRRVAAREYRKNIDGPLLWALRLFITFIVLVYIEFLHRKSGNVDTELLFVNVFAFFFIAVTSNLIINYYPRYYRILLNYPVLDEYLIKAFWHDFLRYSLTSCFELFITFTFLCRISSLPSSVFFAFLISIPQMWAIIVVVGTVTTFRFPQLIARVAVTLSVLSVFIFIGFSSAPSETISILNRIAPYVNPFFPTGWPLYLAEHQFSNISLDLPLIIIFTIIFSDFHHCVALASKRFRYETPLMVGDLGARSHGFRHRFSKISFYLSVAQMFAFLLTDFRRYIRIAEERFHYRAPMMFRTLGTRILRNMIQLVLNQANSTARERSQEFLTNSAEAVPSETNFLKLFELEFWPRTLFERWLWDWLTEREKVVVQFLFPTGIRLTAGWKGVWRTLLMTLVLASSAHLITVDLITIDIANPLYGIWNLILCYGLGCCGLTTVSLFFGIGDAFAKVKNFGIGIPLLAIYPVTLYEISRVLIKYSLVQVPALAAAIIVILSYTLWTDGAGWMTLRWMILNVCPEFCILAIAFRLIQIVTIFNAGNAPCSVLIGAGRCIFWGILFILVFYAVCTPLIPNPLISWSCTFATLAVSYTILRSYSLIYRSRLFDTMVEAR